MFEKIMGIIIKDFNLGKYLQIDKSWTWKQNRGKEEGKRERNKEMK